MSGDMIGEVLNYDLSKVIRPEEVVANYVKKNMADYLDMSKRPPVRLGALVTIEIYRGDSFYEALNLTDELKGAKQKETYVKLGNILVTVNSVDLLSSMDQIFNRSNYSVRIAATVVCTDVSKIVYQPKEEEKNMKQEVVEIGKNPETERRAQIEANLLISYFKKKLDENPDFIAKTLSASAFNSYQKAALRTRGPKSDLIDLCFGLMGETDEVVDQVKKHLYQGHPREQVRGKIKEELGDVMWYAALMAFDFDIDLAEVFEGNVEKLKKRFPDGFDEKRSLERAQEVDSSDLMSTQEAQNTEGE